MTAFISSEAQIDNSSVICELRSVNHRYRDICVKLPEQFRFAEASIRSSIAKGLKRGKIECSLNHKIQPKNAENITVNENAVIALLQATAQIEEHMHTQQYFSALDVLNFPGIQQQTEINKQSLEQGINNIIVDAVEQMTVSREREGAELGLLIKERCNKILVLVDSANKQLPQVLENIRKKILARLSELKLEPDFDRLEQEIVYLTQKLDVAEELDRLQIHINEVLKILNVDEPVGRRLDFLMQEMNREANTLGSKSADKGMTQISIDLKVLIEQMREQVQNIE